VSNGRVQDQQDNGPSLMKCNVNSSTIFQMDLINVLPLMAVLVGDVSIVMVVQFWQLTSYKHIIKELFS
jgi:hypothetical protein